jgi:hypothetical protein
MPQRTIRLRGRCRACPGAVSDSHVAHPRRAGRGLHAVVGGRPRCSDPRRAGGGLSPCCRANGGAGWGVRERRCRLGSALTPVGGAARRTPRASARHRSPGKPEPIGRVTRTPSGLRGRAIDSQKRTVHKRVTHHRRLPTCGSSGTAVSRLSTQCSPPKDETDPKSTIGGASRPTATPYRATTGRKCLRS